MPFLTTHDGRTIRYPDPNIKVNDTIRYDIASSKILDHIRFETGEFHACNLILFCIEKFICNLYF